MNKRMKRKLTTLCLAAAMSLSTCSFSYAATNRSLNAVYDNIKIIYNGKMVPTTQQPFIVSGSTYVPLSFLRNIGAQLTWNGSTKSITINHNTTNPTNTAMMHTLQQQVAQKNLELAQLNQKIIQLQTELNKKNSSSKSSVDEDGDYSFTKDDLEDLEDLLKDNYEHYKNVDFDIDVHSRSSRLEVTFEMDMSSDGKHWTKLSKSSKEDLVEDICYDIWNDYPDIQIRGSIDDSDNDRTLVSFSSRDDQELRVSVNEDLDIDSSDIEDVLEKRYSRIEGLGDDNDVSISHIEINEPLSFDDPTVIVNLRLSYSRDPWDHLVKSSEGKDRIKSLARGIAREFERQCHKLIEAEDITVSFQSADRGYEGEYKDNEFFN